MAAEQSIDIGAWWDRIDEELGALDAAPEMTHDPLRSNELFDTWWVRMTSLDRYTIAAWLSIPTGDGPFPAVMYTPAHMSVVTPAPYEMRARAVTMSVVSRGQRGADTPYAAAYPGHLTHGIENPDRYIYRGVVADTIRAWEVLRELPEVDRDRMAMTGTDLALLVDARRPGATAINVGGSFWYRMLDIAAATDLYPFEEINDHLRMTPGDREAVARTLGYLDPVNHADRLEANVLLHRDRESRLGDEAWFAPLLSRMAIEPTFLDLTHREQVDHDAVDAWLSAQLGMEPYPRSWTPEDIGQWSI
jgi:cephalosporin-C deacetylase